MYTGLKDFRELLGNRLNIGQNWVRMEGPDTLANGRT